MLSIIMQYTPDEWTKTQSYSQIEYPLGHGTEYEKIEKEIKPFLTLGANISRIIRIQNIYQFGQFVMREQLLKLSDPNEAYYRVRRYIKVPLHYRKEALRYHLDYRRCGLGETVFKKNLSNLCYVDIIFIVQVITSDPNSSYTSPQNNSDYYIQYMIEL